MERERREVSPGLPSSLSGWNRATTTNLWCRAECPPTHPRFPLGVWVVWRRLDPFGGALKPTAVSGGTKQPDGTCGCTYSTEYLQYGFPRQRVLEAARVLETAPIACGRGYLDPQVHSTNPVPEVGGYTCNVCKVYSRY